MKTRLNVIRLMLLLLALLAGLPTASAFYDPSAQRWINRDPLATQMHQHNRIWGDQLKIEVAEAPNLYTYVANDPVHSQDPFGLFVPRPKPLPTTCLRTTLIGIGVGICLDIICEIHQQNKRAECIQQCHDTADAGEDNCRRMPRKERRRCWEKLYEDLANCIRDCNRKYPE